MKKILPLIMLAAILMFSLMVSGCVTNQNNNTTNKYAQNGVSFDFPGNWGVVTATSPNAVAAVADPATAVNGSPTTLVVIQKVNVTGSSDLKTVYDQNYAKFFNNTGYKKVSEADLIINNNKVYENVYTFNEGGVEKQYRAVWLSKNGQVYVILCSAKQADFQGQQTNFDMVINSFQV